ncbi:MAG: hypothetical protein JNL10_00945 [Verrucomicrobiales bacterium]|nr:hypothetical protein [Verrucomicrobiales bacterium]
MNPTFLQLAALLDSQTPAQLLELSQKQETLAERKRAALVRVDELILQAEGEYNDTPWRILDAPEGDKRPPGSRATALKSIRALIEQPTSLNQHEFGHCGAAAMGAILITYFPGTFLDFFNNLLVSGAGSLGPVEIAAPYEMMEVTYGDIEVALGHETPEFDAVHWILLATLQYTSSVSEADRSGLSYGNVHPRKLGQLMEGTRFFTNLELRPPTLGKVMTPGDVDIVTKSEHPLREVILLCDGTFLVERDPLLPSGVMNHAIWLMNYSTFGTTVTLEYNTWGRHEVRRVYMKSRFEACCYGVLAFDIDLNAGE